MEISADYTASLLGDVKPVLISSRPFTKNATSSTSIPDDTQQHSLTRELGVSLEAYIAVGSIASSVPVATDMSSSTWNEVLDSRFFSVYFSGPLLNMTLKLFHANWIRVTYSASSFGMMIFRFYLLPDDVAQTTVERDSKSLRSLLTSLISQCAISPAIWDAKAPDLAAKFDIWAKGIDTSLFWMFNKLPSPDPTDESICDRYSRVSLNEFLDVEPQVPGLKAKLYGYQARSVAQMIQKEAAPQIHLDPRFEERVGPDGRSFYYNARENLFRREAPQYESIRGGILAETS
jgi:hypothetical protein